ncbi:MAG: hypothetical protein IJO76_02345 [Clostridia bacterium]|nr:hypothetical protein [Clostridia bacterium]
MKRSVKETVVRLLILLVGLTVAHFGVTLFILANQGTDPFNVLVQGVFRSLDTVLDHSLLTHGNVHMTLCLLIIVALLFIDRSYIKIGTVVCMAAGGPIIDLFTLLLSPLFPDKPSLWLAIPMLVVACAILAFGMTIVIKSDAGTGPNDLVAVVTADKLKRKFSIVRIIVDALFVLIGWLLGGSVGLGTVVCVALVGPVAGLFLPINGKWIGKVIEKV